MPAHSSGGEIEAFLKQVAATPARRGDGRGRLIFALDATASREPTWRQAMRIQADMFRETDALGGLDVQLVSYGGRDFDAGPWVARSDPLLSRMAEVRCAAGFTQIERVLRHAVDETRKGRVNAVVFVGDCMEEMPDVLYGLAGELALLGAPIFIFHEGDDAIAGQAFQRMAALSRGAYCRFDPSSPGQLRDLLSAVAVYAAGGRKALADYGRRTGGVALRLSHQMKDG